MSGSTTIAERISQARNRLLCNPAFQRWAAGFWPTRLIARRHARATFDLCNGFVYSQVLLAAVQLGLLEVLREAVADLDRLARDTGLDRDATQRLVDGCVALQLVRKRRDGRYQLGQRGAVVLGNPSVMAMIRHHAIFYRDLCDPVALLRGDHPATELSRYWAYDNAKDDRCGDDPSVASYSELMSRSQPLVVEQVLRAYDFSVHRCLLDVGGGEGAFVSAVGAVSRSLDLMLFDLPAVAQRARAALASSPAGERVRVIGGDFFNDALPTGADVVSLVRVIHDHDDDQVLKLLRAVRRCLPADGVLLIAEPMSEVAGAEPVGDAYFGFYLLAMGSGRPRTEAQIGVLLDRAGFAPPKLVATQLPLQASLLVARVNPG